MSLREYQKEQLANTKKDYENGIRSLLVAAATGTGKTVYLSQLPEYMGLGGQTFVLIHREELANQAADKIKKWNPHLRVSVEMGDRYANVDDDVIVASVPTLGAEGNARIKRFDPTKVKLMVTDEAHHSNADTYINIYKYFDMLADTPGKLLVGVTATPNRGDGQPLAKVYKKISHAYPIRQAVEDGWLVPIRAIRVKLNADLDKVKTRAGQFNDRELSETINTPVNNQAVVKAWLNEASARQTVAFTTDIQHAKDLAKTFEYYGVKSAAVWGNDPERKDKLELFEREQLQVLCNCDVLTEGYDSWRVACVINDAPTLSFVRYAQRIGRGTRLEEGTGNYHEAVRDGVKLRKRDLLVIDAVGSTTRHSLSTVPSLFGLNARMDLDGKHVLDVVKEIEKAQSDHPELDLSNIESLDQINLLVEDADLWNVKLPDEVVEHATMSWYPSFDGGYQITLPSGDRLNIKQNMLDQWEITATIKGVKYRGVRDTLEAAFQAGEDLIMKADPDSTKVLWKDAKWHKDPPTEGQLSALKRLYKGKTVPQNLTKGQASKLIERAKQEEERVPATTEQLSFIHKFTKGAPIPADLTKPQATRMIAQFIRGKVTGVKA